ncbi:uncharacterized protein PG998_000170 [Apiospora kogelbergensis]|uniref:uncharacterized protein n=1 Tax=Apiospora kogelbergensis TaxID=1337665 RepID=UPI00312DEC33
MRVLELRHRLEVLEQLAAASSAPMSRLAATDVIVHGAWRWFVEWFVRRPAADASADAITDLAAAIAIGDAPADAPADALAGRRFEKKAITRINRIGKKRDVGGPQFEPLGRCDRRSMTDGAGLGRLCSYILDIIGLFFRASIWSGNKELEL